MFKQTQRSFAGGWLDRELMGRTDLAKYYNGASKMQNFLVRRQGNLAKRRGTDFCADITDIAGKTIDTRTGLDEDVQTGNPRLVPIVYERESGYYAIIVARRAFIAGSKGVYHSDGTWRRDMAAYYLPWNAATHVCDASEAECFVEDVPYESLVWGLRSCPPGRTVRLAKDVTYTAGATTPTRCEGTLDLNGHVLTVKDEASMSFSRGDHCGIIDSAHPASGWNIVWDVDATMLTHGHTFVAVSRCSQIRMEGLRCEYPFTGVNASMIRIGTGCRTVTLSYCAITTSARRGILAISGNNPYRDSAVHVVECDLKTEDGSYPMFHNDPAYGYPWSIVVESGYLDCAGLLAAQGARIEGGVVKCTAIGSGGNGRSYARVVAGLVSHQVSGSEGTVDGASELKGTTPDPDDGATTLYNYNLKSEGPYVYSRTPIPSTDPAVLTRVVPYSVEVPYEDGDLEALDILQSGDTLFLAHHSYPPAAIVFDGATMSLSFRQLEFNASQWKRPVIADGSNEIHVDSTTLSTSNNTDTKTTTEYSGLTKTTTVYTKLTSQDESSWVQRTRAQSTMVARTVSYVATYVKDGIESPPSNPFQITYGAPWEEGGTVTLALGKGANAEEPDYYNVYKRESDGYGLVGSTAKPSVADVVPDAANIETTGGEVVYSDPAMSATGSFNGVSLASTDIRDVLAPVDGGVVTDVESRIVGSLGSYRVYRGVGGAKFEEQARLDFDEQSGASVNSVTIWFDTHELSYAEDAATGKVKVSERIAGSGQRVTATVTYRNKTGDQNTATQTVQVTLPPISYTPEGDSEATTYAGACEHYCGEFDADTTAAELRSAIGREPRSATLSFSSVTADKQVVSIDIECEIEEDDGEGGTLWTRVPTCICGMSFGLAAPSGSTFVDDYITPGMSLTPPSGETAFGGRGEYPSCVGMYQQRLVFAATRNRPFGFWMSAVGDLYTFAPHDSIREDDAISAELAATEFPRINHLVVNRDLVMLSDGGEWKIAPVTGNTLTYKTLSATLQSSIGSAKWLKPINVGNEVVFAERTGMTLRSIVYNFASDGYETTDLTVLAGNIFADNSIRRMCYKQHPDSTILCVLQDGTVAAMVYMPEHEVAAWTRQILGGGALAVDCAANKAVNGTTSDVAMIVQRDGRTELWAVRPDDPSPTVAAQACLDGSRTMTGAEATAEGAWLEGWIAVDLLTGVAYASKSALQAVSSYESRSYLCGFPIRSELVTVRPEPSPQDTVQFEIKNLKSVETRTISAGRYTVRSFAAAPGVKPTAAKTSVPVSAGTVGLVAADVATTVLGANTADGRVQIVHEDIWPMQLLLLSANYEIQPLSNSAG